MKKNWNRTIEKNLPEIFVVLLITSAMVAFLTLNRRYYEQRIENLEAEILDLKKERPDFLSEYTTTDGW